MCFVGAAVMVIPIGILRDERQQPYMSVFLTAIYVPNRF